MKPVTGDDKIRPPVEAMKCPRCNSTNTKFCYYNNYSHTQPRHFCKTCRRYWTKGGALRNVPIGGASRKNKIRTTTKSSTSKDYSSSSSIPSSHFGGLRFGLSPTMDQFLQLGGGISDGGRGGLPFSTFPSSFGKDLSSSTAAAMPASGSFMTSSIESLSYINQDLHWKLQQQRLAMLFGGETRSHKDGDGGGEGGGGGGGGGGDSLSALPVVLENQISPAQGISKEEVFAVNNNNPMNTKSCISSGATTTEWFFENSYTPTSTTITNNSGSNESNWNGILAWTDLHQYNALP